jgi:shikimate kinase
MEQRAARIILITGPKHAGKSAVGQALARLSGGVFTDLDELVEQKTGKTPRALFKEGPELFRKAEARALAAAVRKVPPCTEGGRRIIAAGGGLIDNAGAERLLKRIPDIVSVYIDVSPDTAWRRILAGAAGGELPPFLNTENPWQTHLEIHTRRAAEYRAMARIIIDGENKTPQDIAAEIMASLPW